LASCEADPRLADQGDVRVRHVRHLGLPGARVLIAGVGQGVGQAAVAELAAGAAADRRRVHRLPDPLLRRRRVGEPLGRAADDPPRRGDGRDGGGRHG